MKRYWSWIIIIVLLIGFIFMSLIIKEVWGILISFTDKIVDFIVKFIYKLKELIPESF